MSAQSLFISEVRGLHIRVISHANQRWLTMEDVSRVVEYRSTDGALRFFHRHKHAMEAHCAKARIDGEGWIVRLLNEAGVRYLCEYNKRAGAVQMLRWLDAGGMSLEGVHTEPAPTDSSNVLAFKSPVTTAPTNQDERQKAYCRELLKTLLRYSTALEAEDLTHIIEAEVVNLISRRHCPGLNDARYEVFRRYFLQGGDV